MSDTSWRASFVHPQHPWRDFEHTFADEREHPPASIRREASLLGMPSVDVYLLSDSGPWPASSVFTYTESVVGGFADHRPLDYSLDLPAAEETPDPV